MAQSHGKFLWLSNRFSYLPALGTNLHSFISAWKCSRLHLSFKPPGKTAICSWPGHGTVKVVCVSVRAQEKSREIWRALQLFLDNTSVSYAEGGAISNVVMVSLDYTTSLSSTKLEVLMYTIILPPTL